MVILPRYEELYPYLNWYLGNIDDIPMFLGTLNEDFSTIKVKNGEFTISARDISTRRKYIVPGIDIMFYDIYQNQYIAHVKSMQGAEIDLKMVSDPLYDGEINLGSVRTLNRVSGLSNSID